MSRSATAVRCISAIASRSTRPIDGPFKAVAVAAATGAAGVGACAFWFTGVFNAALAAVTDAEASRADGRGLERVGGFGTPARAVIGADRVVGDDTAAPVSPAFEE